MKSILRRNHYISVNMYIWIYLYIITNIINAINQLNAIISLYKLLWTNCISEHASNDPQAATNQRDQFMQSLVHSYLHTHMYIQTDIHSYKYAICNIWYFCNESISFTHARHFVAVAIYMYIYIFFFLIFLYYKYIYYIIYKNNFKTNKTFSSKVGVFFTIL